MKSRILLMVCSLVGIAFMFGGMLIGWTVKGYDSIIGVQGRYFLPFLGLILLALRPRRMVSYETKVKWNRCGLFIITIMSDVIVSYLFIRAT